MSDRRDTSFSTAEQGDESATDGSLVSIDGSDGEPELQVDERAIRQRAVELLESWESDGLLDQVRARTRTVTAAALGVFVLSALLSSSTGITGTVASAWLAVSGVVAVTVGAVALLLRGLRRPRDVADRQGLLAMLAITLLAVGGTHYSRYPASRAAWRYLVTGPLPRRTPTDWGTGGGREPRKDTFPLRRYVRLAGWFSAALVVIHQGWLALLGRETVLSPVVRYLAGPGSDAASGASGSVTGLGTQLTAFESLLVLAGVVLVGTVIGALLAVSRQ
ncbi:MAG: hypothetical protein V5A39_10370 [Haloarculaceae archaeon]